VIAFRLARLHPYTSNCQLLTPPGPAHTPGPQSALAKRLVSA